MRLRKFHFSIFIANLLTVSFIRTTPVMSRAASVPGSLPIQGFQLVTPTEGWVWTDELYWTKDSGQTWTDITPPNRSDGRLAAVSFADSRHGGVILARWEQPVWLFYTIDRTSDGGKTWTVYHLSLFSSPEDTYSDGIDIASLQMFDPYTVWLSVRGMSNSGVREFGTLFKSTDSGMSWTTLPSPGGRGGDAVDFVTTETGWAVVGRMSDQLYRTVDGGQTWQTQTVAGLPHGAQWVYTLPQFVNPQDGLLTVRVTHNENYSNAVFLTHDGGETWQLDSTPSGYGMVALLDRTHWLGIIQGQQEVLGSTTQAGKLTILSRDPFVTDIFSMSFISATTGLAEAFTPYICSNGICNTQFYMLYTDNSGQTWRLLTLPKLTYF